MDKIICLVGPSGSGKTTIAKELEKEGFNVIQSYTTRPPRKPNEWGHIFVKDTPRKWQKIREGNREREGMLIDTTNMIAHQKLYGHHYWATKEQYKNKGTSIYVIDPQGAEQVKENAKDAEVITIYLAVDRGNRIIRLRRRFLTRENCLTINDYFKDDELIHKERNYIRKRINKDVRLFSLVRCDYVVDANREVKKVLHDIKQIIN